MINICLCISTKMTPVKNIHTYKALNLSSKLLSGYLRNLTRMESKVYSKTCGICCVSDTVDHPGVNLERN